MDTTTTTFRHTKLPDTLQPLTPITPMLKQLDVLIGFSVVMLVASLLITIITQMISAALGLRGRNLADALEAMMHKIDPQIGDKVKDLGKQLADKALTCPVISDSTLSMARQWPMVWKRASAIRPDELLEVLRDIAGATVAPAGAPANTQEAAARLLKSLDVPTSTAQDALNAIRAALPALAREKGAAVVHELETAANTALCNLDKWFNSAQDRAQQWFATHTRRWTVIASVVVAFALQLDTFRLLSQITSDDALRASLVSGSGALLKEAEGILKEDTSPTAVGEEALRQLKAKHAKLAESIPAGVKTADTASEWLRTHPNDDKSADAVRKYWELTQTVAREKLDQGTKQFVKMMDGFSKSKFQLVPSPYQWEPCWPVNLHFWGIVVSAALLSLGAPFWFNTLKSLANLRPILAREVDKDPKQRTKAFIA